MVIWADGGDGAGRFSGGVDMCVCGGGNSCHNKVQLCFGYFASACGEKQRYWVFILYVGYVQSNSNT